MNYSELLFACKSVEPWQQDLLIQDLAEYGFDSFEDIMGGFKAYIPSERLDLPSLEALLLNLSSQINVSYEINEIKSQNWNAVWESNFHPIAVGDRCYVRAPFHKSRAEDYKIELIIEPKMAFGTGHHQTTFLMMQLLLELDLRGKTILDMGCGTGILSILAAKLGAKAIVAIDYDSICCESTMENCANNGVTGVTILNGSIEAIPKRSFDVILANINRNILLDHVKAYCAVLKSGGLLLMSGFYVGEDLKLIENQTTILDLKLLDVVTKDNWVAAKFGSALDNKYPV